MTCPREAGGPGRLTPMLGRSQVTTAGPGGSTLRPPPGRRGQAARRRAAAAAAAAAALARRHWLVTALLAAGLVLRVLVMLAYRPALFYIDSQRYLQDAAGMDPVGYNAPLRSILAVANFDAVAAVQHLLGVAMAVVSYLLLLRRGVPRWLAALATAPVLLDAYQLQTEQSVMPGSWFEALIVAGLAVLAWRPRPGWRCVVIGGVLLGTSATVAQIGEAMAVPAVIYLLAAGGGWRRAAGQAAAVCAAFALPILAYCTGSYLVSGQFFLSHTGVTSLYGRTAAAADCATLRIPAAERRMCPAPAQQARGPDWLEYDAASPVEVYYYNILPRARVDAMLSDFNRSVLTQQPQRVLAAYGRDVVKLFAPGRAGSPGDTPVSRWQFQTAFPYFPPHTTRQFVRAEIARYGGGTPAVWRPVAGFLRSYQLDGGYTPGPLLLLSTVAGLAGSAVLLRRRYRADPEICPRALACLLFFASAVVVLGVSDLFEFSWRYQLPALITLPPAGALGVAVLIRLLQRRAAGQAA